jgi:hypothetical protein
MRIHSDSKDAYLRPFWTAGFLASRVEFEALRLLFGLDEAKLEPL